LAGAVGVLIGGFWLAAWLSGVASRWSTATGTITVKTNTALGALLAGAALLLLSPARVSVSRRTVGAVLGAIVLLIGVLTLSEHLFHYNLGIDQLLATEAPGAAATVSPNRMGLPASTSFSLLGAGLLLLAWRRRTIASYFGLAVCLIALLPAIGYVYGINAFYGKAQLTGIAWPTVVALISVGIGLVMAHPENGPMFLLLREDAGGILLRRLLPATLLIPLVLGFLAVQGRNQELYGRATGFGILVLALTLTSAVLLWRSAAHLSRLAAERAAAEHALLNERDFIAAVLDTAGALVCVLDRQGRITRFNRACEAIMGYSPEEVLGRGFWHLIPPDEVSGVREAWEALQAGDLPNTHENHWLAKDGSRRLIAWSNTAILGAEGEIEHIVATGIDITARRQAEEAVEASRKALERERDLLQIVMNGAKNSHLVYLDRDFNFVRVNEAYARTCGYTPEAMIGKNHFALYPNAENEAIFARVRDTGEPAEFHDKAFVFPDQPERGVTYWDWTLIPVKDAAGNVTGLVFSLIETTARKRAEGEIQELNRSLQQRNAELEAERARWQGVVEGIAEEVWVCDTQGKMTLINLPAVTAMGLETFEHKAVEEVLAEVDILYVDGQPRPAEQAPLIRSLRGEVVRGEEIMRHRRTGNTRHRQFSSAPMRDVAGAITGAVAIVRDITEHKRAEQELQKLNRTLRAINNSNQALLHATAEGDLLQDVCRIVTEDCGYAMVWVGYAEEDEGKTVRPVAHSGFEEGYLGTVRITWSDTERGRGPTGTAIRTGRACTCRNMRTDTAFSPWREEALKRGYASALGIPLVSDGKAFGAITIYSREPDAFAKDEVDLLTELTGNLAYGISALRTRAAHEKAEKVLAADLAALTRMHSLSGRLVEASGIQPLLQEVMDAAVAIVGAERGTLQLLEGDSLRIVAHHGHQQPFLEFFAAAENRASVCGAAMQRGERVVVPDIEESSLFAGTPSLPVLRQAGVRAVQSTPLLSRTRTLLGILTTQWGAPYAPDEHDLWRIDLLARQAADLIEHAMAEEALRQSRERLAAVVNSAMDAIITVNQEQRIVMFNAAAEKTFGCPASEAIGRPLDKFIPEQFREIHRRYVREFGETGVTSRSMQSPGKLYGRRGDGQEFPIEATISHVEAGGQKLYTVILRDITLRKQTEESLMRSEKLATVGRLAATIAHEINNPLAAVTNMLFLLRSDQSITPASRQYLDLAEAELQRAGQIANTTLGLSRQAAQPVKFRPAEILDGVLALVSRKLEAKGVRIEKACRAEQLEIIGVTGEIRQVLWNLVSNAVDAIPDQGRIVARVRDSADWRRLTIHGARFTIADTGCGMTPEALQHIFEPFFTTKRTGTGLGLWVTSEIVHRHGGSIKVRSRTGTSEHGTVFSIFIPADGQQVQRSGAPAGDRAISTSRLA
jgi:PAS domain S-box-containing protein